VFKDDTIVVMCKHHNANPEAPNNVLQKVAYHEFVHLKFCVPGADSKTHLQQCMFEGVSSQWPDAGSNYMNGSS